MRRSSLYLMCSLSGLALWLYPSDSASHNLTADWSDAANPNGPWRYRHGATLLPSVPDWDLLTDPMLVQPGWAPGQTIPVWFKSTSNNPEALDMLIGDVVVHSSGAGVAAANVTWTSPNSSVFVISGRAWMMRDLDRGNLWSLRHNDSLLTSGQLSSGDAYSRVNPFEFSSGSGGVSALSGVAMSVGDVIELRVEQNQGSGDFVGLEMEIIDDVFFVDHFE